MIKCLASIWLDENNLRSVEFDVDCETFFRDYQDGRTFNIEYKGKTYQRNAQRAGSAVRDLILELEGK